MRGTNSRAMSLLLLAALLAACAGQRAGDGISKERAIEIARQKLTFEAQSVDAVPQVAEGRAVWQVTFHGAGPSQVQIGEILIVTVDRQTGEIVAIAMS